MKKTNLFIFFAILGLLGLVSGSLYWMVGQGFGSKTQQLETDSVPEQTRVLAIAHLEPAGGDCHDCRDIGGAGCSSGSGGG
ncbi:MAG: hypothetical protein HC799_06535 [Limnothrix sp. RL_2_0]|nr:hypothetical protein [Limnothrix sp. RL_2_0]